jgi:hypothetical protein
MTRTQEHLGPQPQRPQTGRTDQHPPWCDPTRCTTNPDSQTGRYRADVGGEHLSAPVLVNLTTAVLLPVREGTAWLSQACALWTCDTYLRVQVGDVHLSMPAADAWQVLADLSALLALTATAEEVTR